MFRGTPSSRKILLSTRESIYGGGEKFLQMVASEFRKLDYAVVIRSPKDSMLRKRLQNVAHVAYLKSKIGGISILNDFRSLWLSLILDRSVKRIFVVHGIWQISRLRLLICWIFRIKVATVSSDLLKVVQRLQPQLNSVKLDVGPTFYDFPTRESMGVDFCFKKTEVTVGTIARLDPIKNLSLFCKVIEALRLKGISVQGKILCPIPISKCELELFSTIGDDAHKVHGQDPYNFLQSLDLFISTSKSESLGLAHLEALACQVPVVSTAVGGPSEYLIEELALGYIPYQSDPNEIADRIIEVLCRANSLKYWERARAVLKSRGPAIMAKQLLDLL